MTYRITDIGLFKKINELLFSITPEMVSEAKCFPTPVPSDGVYVGIIPNNLKAFLCVLNGMCLDLDTYNKESGMSDLNDIQRRAIYNKIQCQKMMIQITEGMLFNALDFEFPKPFYEVYELLIGQDFRVYKIDTSLIRGVIPAR